MLAIAEQIAQELNVNPSQIKTAINLLDDGSTVPFIARYRKERTGNLDEVEIGAIVTHKEVFEAIEKRKKTILKSLENQGVLTAELKQKVETTKEQTSL